MSRIWHIPHFLQPYGLYFTFMAIHRLSLLSCFHCRGRQAHVSSNFNWRSLNGLSSTRCSGRCDSTNEPKCHPWIKKEPVFIVHYLMVLSYPTSTIQEHIKRTNNPLPDHHGGKCWISTAHFLFACFTWFLFVSRAHCYIMSKELFLRIQRITRSWYESNNDILDGLHQLMAILKQYKRIVSNWSSYLFQDYLHIM